MQLTNRTGDSTDTQRNVLDNRLSIVPHCPIFSNYAPDSGSRSSLSCPSSCAMLPRGGLSWLVHISNTGLGLSLA